MFLWNSFSLKNILSYPKNHPVIFGVGFSCAKTSFADYLVQRYIEGRERIDYLRNLAFGTFGLVYLGGIQYWIYVPLFRRLFPYALKWTDKPLKEKLRDKKGLITMGKQVFLDQCVHHPLLYFPCFYLTKALVTGNSIQQAKQSYMKNISTDIVALWKLWIPAMIINFTVSPFWLRIPFVACTSLLWTCILSAMRGATELVGTSPEKTMDAIGNVGTAVTERWYKLDNPNNAHVLLIAIGADRVGLISDVTSVVLQNGGNIFESRMHKFGEDLVMIMHISLDKEDNIQLNFALAALPGVRILSREMKEFNSTNSTDNLGFSGRFTFNGPDEPGIVNTVMKCLKKYNLNIQTLETDFNSTLDRSYFEMKGTFSAGKDIDNTSLVLDYEDLKNKYHKKDAVLTLELKEKDI